MQVLAVVQLAGLYWELQSFTVENVCVTRRDACVPEKFICGVYSNCCPLTIFLRLIGRMSVCVLQNAVRIK